MARLQHLGRTLLLAALVLGLNALGLLTVLHARHPGHVRANVTHGHHSSSRRASRSRNRGDSSLQSGTERADSHVAPKFKPIADFSHPLVMLAAMWRFSPGSISAPLAEASVASLGSAPRAPGGARAPPLS